MKKQRFTGVSHLDTCLPDFFTGYSYPVVSVPCFNGMTRADLADGIESEINSMYDYFVHDLGYTESDMTLFDSFCANLRAENPDGVIYNNPDEPEDDEFCDCCYMYFGLCRPVHVGGLTFLNE